MYPEVIIASAPEPEVETGPERLNTRSQQPSNIPSTRGFFIPPPLPDTHTRKSKRRIERTIREEIPRNVAQKRTLTDRYTALREGLEPITRTFDSATTPSVIPIDDLIVYYKDQLEQNKRQEAKRLNNRNDDRIIMAEERATK